MSQKLINRSPDLKMLQDEGYEIEINGGHLVAHHIPYVNNNKEIKYGKLISTLCLNNDVTIPPDNHVIYFMGEHPCDKNGQIIIAISHSSLNQLLAEGIVMNYSFSNRPANGYSNYYEKITTYEKVISSPAKAIDKNVTAKTFRVVQSSEHNFFKYFDSNSSRANISQLNRRFHNQKIGIIGLGGTGSYILDLIAKTEIEEIRLYDDDVFLQHNSFRIPGAASSEVLNKKMLKVEYLESIYSRIHNNVIPNGLKIDSENFILLTGLSFVFICIDSNESRKQIVEGLQKLEIGFIDCGLGVNTTVDDSLTGQIRITSSSDIGNSHLVKRLSFEDAGDNEYSQNIQIAELNCLNATFAVIMWKKQLGFYSDIYQELNLTYNINTSQLIKDEHQA
jgi:molybdopterin/thiamine biosynthesis adenylyltransferase